MRPGAALRQLLLTKDWFYGAGAWLGGRINSRSLQSWRPTPSERPGVNFIGPVEFQNGLGVSARGYVASLMHAGLPVNVLPWRSGFERLQARRFHYPVLPEQPVNIVHLNLDLLRARRYLHVPPLADLVCSRRYNILIFYWELESLLPEWAPQLRRFDEIWCASSFIAQAASKACSKTVRVVRPALLSGGETQTGADGNFGFPKGRFVFFYIADAGSVFGRKNPHGLVRAYVEEFSENENACCVLKINYSELNKSQMNAIRAIAGGRSDVVIMDSILADADMRRLFGAIDCYVSPHRSEGLGLTILEAMNAKKPVIATPYGGVTDFVNKETAMPLSYRIEKAGDNNLPYPANYQWAEPEHVSLRAAMRAIFRDRSLAQRIGGNGYKRVQELFSLEATSCKIRNEIQSIWTGQSRPKEVPMTITKG